MIKHIREPSGQVTCLYRTTVTKKAGILGVCPQCWRKLSAVWERADYDRRQGKLTTLRAKAEGRRRGRLREARRLRGQIRAATEATLRVRKGGRDGNET